MQNEWTTDLIDSLLRHPSELAEDALYGSLIKQYGGVTHIYEQFKTLTLKANLNELLTIILEHPYATIDWYAENLVIHRATFYRHYKALIQALLDAFQRGIIQPVPLTSQEDFVNPFPLPMPSTKLIGRIDELTQIKQLIDDSNIRLITLVGPGGIGKTCLAQQIAWDNGYLFSDGILWLDLVPLQNAASIVSTLAYQLKIKGPDTQDLLKSISEWLKSRHMGIVFDNCEHIMDIVPIIQTLLSHVPQLKIITTSRRVLGLYGEHRVVITPLSLTTPPQRPFAIDLFLSRSAAHGVTVDTPDYPYVTAICQQLDGMPLAIELAATHVGKIPLAMIQQRLHEQVMFLSTSQEMNDERHSSLEAALRWSIELLPKQVQTLFMYLAVFQGSWGIEPFYEICKEFKQHEVDYMLRILTDHQLVQIEPSFPPRYRLLEPVRAFASDMLTQSQQKDDLFQRHAQAFLSVVQQLFAQRHKLNVVANYAQEYTNILSAMEYLFEHDIKSTFECFIALIPYWNATPTPIDGEMWQKQLEPFVQSVDTLQQAHFWAISGMIYDTLMKRELAIDAHKKALTQYKIIGDLGRVAMTLNNLGSTTIDLNDLDQAADYFLQSISIFENNVNLQDLNIVSTYAVALSNLGLICTYQNKLDQAFNFNILAYDIFDFYQHYFIIMCFHRLAFLYHKKFDYQASLNLLLRIPEKFPNVATGNVGGLTLLSYTYLGLQDYQKVFETLHELYLHASKNVYNIRDVEFMLGCAYLLYEMNYWQQSIILYGAAEAMGKSPLVELTIFDTIWLRQYQDFRAQVDPKEWHNYYEQGRFLNKTEAWQITLRCLTPLFGSPASQADGLKDLS